MALAEIELCGELMIAAATASEERLSADRIDEVLRSAPGPAELGEQARYWAWGRGGWGARSGAAGGAPLLGGDVGA